MSQASATVELKGDDASLTQALQESERDVQSFGTKLTTVFTGITAGIQIAGLMKDAFAGLGSIFGSFIEGAAHAEESEARLAAVIKATGGAAGFTGEQLVAFADQLETVTKYESEATQAAIGIIATFRNVRGDNFLEATKLAQDMATVLGTDVSGSAMQVAKALNDPLQGINALRRAGVSFTESQKDMIDKMLKAGDVVGAQRVILDELRNEFGGAAEAVGDTFNGALIILENQLGVVTDQIGGAFLDAFAELSPVIWDTVTVLQNLTPVFVGVVKSAIEFGKGLMDAVAPALGFLVDGSVAAFSVLQAMWDNWRDTANLALLEVALGIEKFWQGTKHVFVDVLPASLKWLAENWYNILVDMANIEVTIFDNMLKNLWDFGTAIYDFLNGKDFDFKFTALLDGFEATVSEFPKIAERAKSATEMALEAEIGSTANKLAESATKHYIENKKFLDGLLVKQEKEGPDMTPAEGIDEYDLEGFKTKKEKKKKEKKKPKEKKEEKSDAGSFEGLEELSKRIQSGSFKTPEVKAAEDTKIAVNEVKDKIDEKGDEELDAMEEEVSAIEDVKDSIEDLDNTMNDEEGPAALVESFDAVEKAITDDYANAAAGMEKSNDKLIELAQRRNMDIAELVKINSRMLEIMLAVNHDTTGIHKNTAKPTTLI